MAVLAVLVLLLVPTPAAAGGLTVVSAASFLNPGSLAPDSWGAAFGQNLARGTFYGELGQDGQFPFEVGGVTIEVNGEPARIHFVSPGQVNFLIPLATTAGLASFVLRSSTTGVVLSQQAQVLTASPSLFSVDSSGSGPGSILNGATFAPEPFRVETPENTGADKRTRLAIFGSGFRFAQTLQAVLTIPSGHQYALELEYFGPAPGFFGLDQANVVLPAELDANVAVSASLRTSSFRSNEVTFTMVKMPSNQVRLLELRLDKSTVLGGESVMGTLRLNGRAGVGGVPVTLRSQSPLVSMPAQVTVPEGEVQTAFRVDTGSPNELQEVEIRAISGSVDLSVPLQIQARNPILLDRIVFDPEIVQGGREATGSVWLREPAASMLEVSLSSGAPGVAWSRTPSVTIFPGGRSAEFTVLTTVVDSRHDVVFTASIEGSQVSEPISVRPAVARTASPASLLGGNPVALEVRIAEPAPAGGARVRLQSPSPYITLPFELVVPAGLRSATEQVDTIQVVRDENVEITAIYRNVGATVSVTLRAPASSTLASLTLNPTTVKGGQLVSGTVTLTGPAPLVGVRVELSNNNPLAIFRMPLNVTIPQGQSLALFTVETAKVSFAENVTIRAKVGNVEKTANLTVNP